MFDIVRKNKRKIAKNKEVTKCQKKRLKDYKGFSIWKCKDEKNKIFYTANDKNENIFDVKTELPDLKKAIDRYIR